MVARTAVARRRMGSGKMRARSVAVSGASEWHTTEAAASPLGRHHARQVVASGGREEVAARRCVSAPLVRATIPSGAPVNDPAPEGAA